MKKLTFEKYGLSPEKVEQLRAYKKYNDQLHSQRTRLGNGNY